jgi:hypothetical protein
MNKNIIVDGYVATTLTDAVHPRIAAPGLTALEMMYDMGLNVNADFVAACLHSEPVLSLTPRGPQTIASEGSQEL